MKKILTILLLSTSLLTLVSCGSSKGEANNSSTQKNTTVQTNDKSTTSEKDKVSDKEDNHQKEEAKEKTESNTPEKSEAVTITVYTPNADADGLDEKAVTINHLTAYSVVNALVDNKVVPSGTRALKFDTKNNIGYLDISSDIYNLHSGSIGETLMLDSLRETFLKAFKVDKLKLTVNGSTYTGSHVDYGPNDYL